MTRRSGRGSVSLDENAKVGPIVEVEHAPPGPRGFFRMSWQGVLGHDDVVEQFRRRLDAGRVNGTFLFVGPPGVGKRMTAERLAAALLCRQGRNTSLDPCGEC